MSLNFFGGLSFLFDSISNYCLLGSFFNHFFYNLFRLFVIGNCLSDLFGGLRDWLCRLLFDSDDDFLSWLGFFFRGFSFWSLLCRSSDLFDDLFNLLVFDLSSGYILDLLLDFWRLRSLLGCNGIKWFRVGSLFIRFDLLGRCIDLGWFLGSSRTLGSSYVNRSFELNLFFDGFCFRLSNSFLLGLFRSLGLLNWLSGG